MKPKAILTILLALWLLPVFPQDFIIKRQQCVGTRYSDDAGCVTGNEIGGYYMGITIQTDTSAFENYHGKIDAVIIKTDSSGNTLWQKCYGGSEDENVTKIVQIDNQSLYMVAHTKSTDGDVQSANHGGGDIWVVKTDTAGNILREKCLGGPGTEHEKDALLTSDGGILVVAQIDSAGGDIGTAYGAGDIWLCRLDASLNIVWEKTLGNEYADDASQIIRTTHNTYMLIGTSSHEGGMVQCQKDTLPYRTDVWLVETDTGGNLLNQFCYGGSYDDYGKSITETENGYMFIGGTNSNDMDVSGLHGTYAGEDDDIWAVNIDSTGTLLWQHCLGSTRYDDPVAAFKTDSGGYTIFGRVTGEDGDVTNKHGYFGADIWMVTLDNNGNIISGSCFGSFSQENFIKTPLVFRKNDYNYAVLTRTDTDSVSGDIGCVIPSAIWYMHYPFDWFFEIKDCNGYLPPPVPDSIEGPDVLCTDTVTEPAKYTITSVSGASGYEWLISPPGAGTVISTEDTSAFILWDNDFKGTGIVFVRSHNECHASAWSPLKTTDVNICSNIPENSTDDLLKVYPNPAKDIVWFETKNNGFAEIVSISVYDAMGRQVADIHPSRKMSQWNTTGLPAGLYFYRYQNGQKTSTGSIMLRR